MTKRNVRWSENSYSADIPEPYGQYTILIQTALKTPISLNSHF